MASYIGMPNYSKIFVKTKWQGKCHLKRMPCFKTVSEQNKCPVVDEQPHVDLKLLQIIYSNGQFSIFGQAHRSKSVQCGKTSRHILDPKVSNERYGSLSIGTLNSNLDVVWSRCSSKVRQFLMVFNISSSVGNLHSNSNI